MFTKAHKLGAGGLRSRLARPLRGVEQQPMRQGREHRSHDTCNVEHLGVEPSDGPGACVGQIELRKSKVVLLAEYLPQGLLMLEHILGVRASNPEIYNKKVRISKKDNSRTLIEKDEAVMQLARKGCWADQILYEEAKKIFFSVFTRFLQSRGDPVTNVTEALERYELGPLSPANIQYQNSLMPVSSKVPAIPDRVPKVE